MCVSGKKRKSTPGEVLDEGRMPADSGSGAGTLRGEKEKNAITLPILTLLPSTHAFVPLL